jgi:hypothetical protein
MITVPTKNQTNTTITPQINEYKDLLYEIKENVSKLLEKKQKNKKNTYYKVTKSMFDIIKEEYPDFPQDKMDLLYNDGENNYINIGNKKYLLNKKNFLKFINFIMK